MKREIESQLPLKPVEFLVLAVLQEGRLHGYGMVQKIGERTEGVVKVRPGDLYRVLYRLVERGLLEPVDRRVPKGGDERRTYYGLTKLGERVLRAEAELLSGIIAQVRA